MEQIPELPLYYNYDKSKVFCEEIGLFWLGDNFVRAADREAKALDFTQAQVDAAMRHHLWQVRYLFCPKSYSFLGRVKLAFYFLTGIKGK